QIIQITNKESNGSQVGGPIIIPDPVDEGITKLTGEKLKELQNEDEEIIVETDLGTLKLDAGSVNLDDIRKQFNQKDVDPNESEIHIGVSEADSSEIEGFKQTSTQRQVQPVGQPIQFAIEVSYKGQTRPVTVRGWAEYTLPVPDELEITTGVLYKHGEIHHQPT